MYRSIPHIQIKVYTLPPKIINKIIEKVEELFCLGLTLDTHVNWKKTL